MSSTHHYAVTCDWSGSTGDGYENYDRAHSIAAEAAGAEPPSLALSSDPAFRGDPAKLNPEQLLVAAASSCQLLSFLAVAARARIDVVGYADHATGEMPEDVKPMHITKIVLRPRIEVTAGPAVEKVERLVEVAHHECFIANSLKTEIAVEPEIVFVDG